MKEEITLDYIAECPPSIEECEKAKFIRNNEFTNDRFVGAFVGEIVSIDKNPYRPCVKLKNIDDSLSEDDRFLTLKLRNKFCYK